MRGYRAFTNPPDSFTFFVIRTRIENVLLLPEVMFSSSNARYELYQFGVSLLQERYKTQYLALLLLLLGIMITLKVGLNVPFLWNPVNVHLCPQLSSASFSRTTSKKSNVWAMEGSNL